MLGSPTKSVPGGFLLVFFGLLALIFAGLAGYAGWLAYQTDFFTEAEKPKAVLTFCCISGTGLLVAILLGYCGLRMAAKVELYDPNDPKSPNLKW